MTTERAAAALGWRFKPRLGGPAGLLPLRALYARSPAGSRGPLSLRSRVSPAGREARLRGLGSG